MTRRVQGRTEWKWSVDVAPTIAQLDDRLSGVEWSQGIILGKLTVITRLVVALVVVVVARTGFEVMPEGYAALTRRIEACHRHFSGDL